MTKKNKSTGIRLWAIAETEIPPQERYAHEAMALFGFLLPHILELKESRFILRKVKHRGYQLECVYKATEKDGIFGEKTATTELMGTPNLKVLVDAMVEWGGKQKHPPGTALSLRFEVARELQQYSYIFLQILHHRKDFFVETASLGKELRGLFDTIIETEIVYLYEQGKEKKCRILDKDLLGKLKQEILISKERVEAEQVFLPAIRFPKQYLDTKHRVITPKDLKGCPVDLTTDEFKPDAINRENIEVAIKGGLQGISWTFEQNKILHGIFSIFDSLDYPDTIDIKRTELYEAMGLKKQLRGGQRRFMEGPKGKQRKRIDKNLTEITKKFVPFLYYASTGKDRKGKTVGTLALDYSRIMKIVPVWKEVEQLEFEEFKKDGKVRNKIDKKLSHYSISINQKVKGDVQRYYRKIPPFIPQKISEFRTARGERGSTIEVDFIEFIYKENRTPIDINFKELAKTLKIKSINNTARVRKILDRCYETAMALGFVLKVEKDVPGLLESKDSIYLNEENFYKPLKKDPHFSALPNSKSSVA